MTASPVDASSGVWSAQPLVPRTQPPTTNTADLLGSGARRRSQDLQSADPMSDLASQRGVPSSSPSSIDFDPEANAPQAEPAPSGSDLSQPATDIANATAAAGTGQDQGAIFLGGPTSDRAQSNLTSLAETLGIDPSTLLAELSSGRDLSSLLSAGSDAGYGTPGLHSNASGILVDQYA